MPTLEIAVGNIRFFWRVFHEKKKKKFGGACYVLIFRNLSGLATNKCCVIGTLNSTQFSQIFLQFT